MSKVTKCMCEECHYNQNYNCHAEGIEVMSSGTNKVQTSEHTCCNTFKPKTMS